MILFSYRKATNELHYGKIVAPERWPSLVSVYHNGSPSRSLITAPKYSANVLHAPDDSHCSHICKRVSTSGYRMLILESKTK